MNVSWHANHPMPQRPSDAQRLAWHLAHQKHCGCRPIPARLLGQMQQSGSTPRSAPGTRGRPRPAISLRGLLSGGDRRSLARSARASALVNAKPERISELAALLKDDDWLVVMRALDLLEKLAHQHPDWVDPYKRLFVGPLADSEKWEIRLQIVRLLPLLDWPPRDRPRVLEILRRDLEHTQKFVRAWALDSLATFAHEDRSLLAIVTSQLESFERSNSKALATRARLIRARLSALG